MAFALKSVDELFPTPLFRFEVADAKALNHGLLKEIAFRRKAEGGVSKSNRRGWHSESDLFERKEPAHAALVTHLLRMMADATRQVAPETDFGALELVCDGWVNVNPRGAYNAPHDHSGAFWSGCYYVHMPSGSDRDSGAIEFLSPHKPLPTTGAIRAPITSDKRRIIPEAGTVLLFPASMQHWVHPNDSSEDRVTIAFNGRFRVKAPSTRVIPPPIAARPRS